MGGSIRSFSVPAWFPPYPLSQGKVGGVSCRQMVRLKPCGSVARAWGRSGAGGRGGGGMLEDGA